MIRVTSLPIAALLTAAVSSNLHAATIKASNSAGLTAAVGRATAGDVIVLAPGAELGRVTITAKFGRSVTIMSSDPNRPAHLDGMKLDGAQNIIFVRLVIGRDRGNEPDFSKLVEIRNSTDIVFVGGSIHGSLDGDPRNDMIGLFAATSARLRLYGVDIQEVFRGIALDRCRDIVIENNGLRKIRSDGINLAGVTGARIASNFIADFSPKPGDHADAIQFWTTNQKQGSSDIEIVNNLIVSGPTARAQGILIGDESKLYEQNAGYSRIRVYGNTLIGTGWHGISATAPIEDLTIADNTLLQVDGADPVKSNWIKAINGRVTNNLAPRFILADGVLQTGNRVNGVASSDEQLAIQKAWLLKRVTGIHK